MFPPSNPVEPVSSTIKLRCALQNKSPLPHSLLSASSFRGESFCFPLIPPVSTQRSAHLFLLILLLLLCSCVFLLLKQTEGEMMKQLRASTSSIWRHTVDMILTSGLLQELPLNTLNKMSFVHQTPRRRRKIKNISFNNDVRAVSLIYCLPFILKPFIALLLTLLIYFIKIKPVQKNYNKKFKVFYP